MKARAASLLKIEAIIDLAVTDQGFLAELKSSPDAALKRIGVEMTPTELAGLKDVMTGTQVSRLAQPPVRTRNAISVMRKAWLEL